MLLCIVCERMYVYFHVVMFPLFVVTFPSYFVSFVVAASVRVFLVAFLVNKPLVLFISFVHTLTPLTPFFVPFISFAHARTQSVFTSLAFVSCSNLVCAREREKNTQKFTYTNVNTNGDSDAVCRIHTLRKYKCWNFVEEYRPNSIELPFCSIRCLSIK